MRGVTVPRTCRQPGLASLGEELRDKAEQRTALVLARCYNTLLWSEAALIAIGRTPNDGLVRTCRAIAALLREYYDDLTTEDDRIRIGGILLHENREQKEATS